MGGEPWTIECLDLPGAGHREDSIAIAELLRRTEGIDADAVHVQHDEESSSIYYGRYYRRIDRLKGVRHIPDDLREDLAAIKELYDDLGRRIFLAARMVPQPLADVGPPEWDLRNVKGIYSLQVAVFFATPKVRDYKQAAVDKVSALRKKGYQAYYHHGDSQSVVTVGVFGGDAVVDYEGGIDYSPKVRALQRKEDFVYNVTNGAIWTAVVDGKRAPVRSLLVEIPVPREPVP